MTDHLSFSKFSLQESDVKSTFVEICQEVSDFLAMPVDVKLESVTDFKAYEANRIQEKTLKQRQQRRTTTKRNDARTR